MSFIDYVAEYFRGPQGEPGPQGPEGPSGGVTAPQVQYQMFEFTDSPMSGNPSGPYQISAHFVPESGTVIGGGWQVINHLGWNVLPEGFTIVTATVETIEDELGYYLVAECPQGPFEHPVRFRLCAVTV